MVCPSHGGEDQEIPSHGGVDKADVAARKPSVLLRDGRERYFCNCGYDGVIFANADPNSDIRGGTKKGWGPGVARSLGGGSQP